MALPFQQAVGGISLMSLELQYVEVGAEPLLSARAGGLVDAVNEFAGFNREPRRGGQGY